MRVGGDYGYCGGVQVAEQVHQVNQLLRFLAEEPTYRAHLAALNHPLHPAQPILHVLGADQSQTHFCAKPDGIVLKNFNKGAPNAILIA